MNSRAIWELNWERWDDLEMGGVRDREKLERTPSFLGVLSGSEQTMMSFPEA